MMKGNNDVSSCLLYSPRSNSNSEDTPASSSRLLQKGNIMTKSSSVKEWYSFGPAKHNKHSRYRRTKSCIDMTFETLTNKVPNISVSLSSDENLKGKFYETMKKVSTSQQLHEEHYTPGHSPKLIMVKPMMPIK